MPDSQLPSYLLMQRAALEYLDQTGSLEMVYTRCDQYALTDERAFHFVIPLDPSDLLDLAAPFGNIVLNKPACAASVFKEVIYVVMETLQLLPQCQSPAQVVVHLRITMLPSLPCYQMDSCRDLILHAGRSQLLQLRGVACGVSTFHKYTTDFVCRFCCSLLQEDLSCRVLAEKLVIELIDEAAFERHTLGASRHQAVMAYVRDDLAHGVEIGQTYIVIGVPVLYPGQQTLVLEVNNIIRHDETNLLYQNLHVIDDLPDTIRRVYNDRIQSPWSFPLSMAYSFASSVTMAGSFLHLKLGLLLSLVGEADSQVGRGLDVLAVGCDTSLLLRLLQYAGCLSRRLVLHQAACPLTAALTKRPNYTMINGGSLLLANGGVCLLPDLSTAKRSFKETLQQVLETGEVHTELGGRRAGEGRVHRVFLPVRCSVWAVTDPLSQKHHGGAGEPGHLLGDTVRISQQLSDVFSMVYFADLAVDSYAESMVVHQSLMTAMGMYPAPLISEMEFKQLLEAARRVQAELSPQAEYLIRAYYVASRRVRASSGVTLPQTAVATITSLARAHAQLRLCETVTEEDAVLAVLLYEESATHRYGQSSLGVKPLDHIQDNDIDSYIGPQRDDKLRIFQQQLRHFISMYAAEVDLPGVEE